MKKTLSIILILIIAMSVFVACGEDEVTPGEAEIFWENATYKEDATVGTGEKTVTVTFEALGKVVKLTVKTDAENLGAALYENGLLNDPSFFNIANGMVADWDKDRAYWAFYIGNDMAPYGVDSELIENGKSYRIVYTK